MYLLFLVLLQAAGSSFGPPHVVGTVADQRANEISGIVASLKSPGVIWAHNDSGTGPVLFAMTPAGLIQNRYQLKGAKANDWEDISRGPGPESGVDYLYIADMGNNNAHTGDPRPHVTLYRIPEPPSEPASKKTIAIKDVSTFQLTYPDGAHDVEAMLVDPVDGKVYVFSKRDPRSIVFSFAAPKTPTGTYQFERHHELGVTMLVGADISPDGSLILLKDYNAVWLYRRQPGEALLDALKRQPEKVSSYVVELQGEAICFDAKASGFYTISEFKITKSVPVYFYPKSPSL